MSSRIELTAQTKYELLLEISQRIRGTLDLDEILNHLLDTIRSVLDYDAGGIFVLNQDLVRPRYERPRELIAAVVERGFDEHQPGADPMRSLGKGIVGHVIRTGQSVVIPDVRFDYRYVEGRRQTLSEIAVPLLRNARPIGALNLESDRLSVFDDSHVEVLSFFADAAAISIEKAMLHRQILEKEQIEEQLHVARQVQSRLLPSESPSVRGYDIAGVCIPTYEIGGDYFDYVHLANDRLGVAVADVSGHGVPAALMMMAFRALLRTHAERQSRPSHIMQAINRLLPQFTGVGDFVTSVYGVLDLKGGHFTYANSGHNPPMLVRADGRVEELNRGGPVLSVMQDARYDDGAITLAGLDLLVLYTDGVVEVTRGRGEQFSVERLVSTVHRSRDLPAAAMIRRVIQATREFSGCEGYQDDFTLVLIKREGNSAAQGSLGGI